MNNKQIEFYMVFVEGEKTPAFKHDTIESAKNEAVRLCESLKKDVFILKSIKGIVRKSSFDIIEMKSKEEYNFDNELPFQI